MKSYDAFLRKHGLRPTRQRLIISELLFTGGHRHVTAEMLRADIAARGHNMSLATIYNTLNQFNHVGLLREIKLEDNVTYYDTNTEHHHHFYNPKSGTLMDIDGDKINIDKLPRPPKGHSIERVDVVIRIS